MKMRCQVEEKEEGQGEGGWIRQEKTWKESELDRETKSIGSNGEYFCTVATPNREKPKEEEAVIWSNSGKLHRIELEC